MRISRHQLLFDVEFIRPPNRCGSIHGFIYRGNWFIIASAVPTPRCIPGPEPAEPTGNEGPRYLLTRPPEFWTHRSPQLQSDRISSVLEPLDYWHSVPNLGSALTAASYQEFWAEMVRRLWTNRLIRSRSRAFDKPREGVSNPLHESPAAPEWWRGSGLECCSWTNLSLGGIWITSGAFTIGPRIRR